MTADLKHAVRRILSSRIGPGEALTGEQIRQRLQEQGIACGQVRRVQEAVQRLRLDGMWIASRSSCGYFVSLDPEALAESVQEARRRALSALHALRVEKRKVAEARGQQRIGAAT